MEAIKKIGIWLDHSSAHFIDTNEKKETFTIDSKFTFEVKEEALSRSEDLMHNKEQQMHESYYKKIADQILKYDHVLLFGPTNAKTELNNFLNEDLHFKKVKIDVKSADKMTENEKIAFVKKYFDE